MLEELGVAPRVAAASEAWLGALADARRESVEVLDMTAVATRPAPAAAMKWWGWGDEGVAFTHEDKPALGAVPRASTSASTSARRDRSADRVRGPRHPEPQLTRRLRAALERRSAPSVSDDALDRVVHARGKSLRDLVRQRRGDLGRLPDVVVRPADEDAGRPRSCAPRSSADAVVIPFGGGTSISGSLEAPRRRDAAGHLGRPRAPGPGARRSTRASRLARVQAGVVRPATSRSSSTRRAGRSATSPTASPTRRSAAGSPRARRACSPTATATSPTSTRGLRVVTPSGMLVTRPVPAHLDRPERARDGARQRGPAGDHHRGDRARPAACPTERMILGYLFPTLGRRRSPRCATSRPARRRRRSRACPTPTRRAFSFATRKAPDAASTGSSPRRCRTFLQRRRASTSSRCACRSSATRARERTSPRSARRSGKIVKRHGGLCIGSRPRRAVRPEEVRHALHPRLPARPRRARRRVGDRGAVERA